MNNRWIHAFPKGISIKWNMDSSFIVWTHISRSISKYDNFNILPYKLWRWTTDGFMPTNTPPICMSTLFRGHGIHLHIIPILVYVLLNGSVINIHVGNEHGNRWIHAFPTGLVYVHGNSSSKPAQGCLHFSLSTDTLGKGNRWQSIPKDLASKWNVDPSF